MERPECLRSINIKTLINNILDRVSLEINRDTCEEYKLGFNDAMGLVTSVLDELRSNDFVAINLNGIKPDEVQLSDIFKKRYNV